MLCLKQVMNTEESDNFEVPKIIHLQSPFTIGRSLESSLILKDLRMSRNHCTLVQSESSSWVLIDTSNNGCWVNDISLLKDTPHNLAHGDTIHLSNYIVFTFHSSETASEDHKNDAVERFTLDQVDKRLAELEKRLELEHSSVINNLKDELKEVRDSETKIKLALDEVQERLSKKCSESALLKNECDRLKTDMESSEKLKLEQEAQLVDKMKTTLNLKDLEISIKEEEMESLKNDFKQQVHQSDVLKDALNYQEGAFSKSITEYAENEDRLEKKISTLEQELSFLQSELLKANANCKTNQESAKSVNHEHDKLVQMIDDLQSKFHLKESELGVKEEELKSLKKDYKRQLKKCDLLKEELNIQEVAFIKNAAEHATQEAHLEKKIKTLEVEIKGLRSELLQANTGKDYALECQLQKFEEILENEVQCAICTEAVITATVLNCSHTFCDKCIVEWREIKGCCPTCRRKIKDLTHVKMLDDMIDRTTEVLTDEFKERRLSVRQERGETESQAGPSAAKRKRKSKSVIVAPQAGSFIDLTTMSP